ncbi:40-kDa huntingtin-associated protein-like [Ornithodoros turicata]|uniref:40-kDa huntingtin-associated protein-like n=1 Tax=Ornithodoros turicata TaxID=34597 RepID=UPI003139ACCF
METADFMQQYKSISQKLKKRFLRKPNLAEVSDQYSTLARQLQQQDCPQYAGMCSMAAARCEQSMGNPGAEAQVLAQGARQFLSEEAKAKSLLCPSMKEALCNAMHCYGRAIQLQLDAGQGALAQALCCEAAESLESLGHPHEALGYLTQAASMQSKCPLSYITTLDKTITCQLAIGDKVAALTAVTEICSVARENGMFQGRPIGAFADALADAEVTCLLLLLLLRPPKPSPEQSRLLDQYLYDSPGELTQSKPVYIGEDLFLLLRSLVMTLETRDREAVKILQQDLWPLVSARQNDLLNDLIEELSR